ncbi:hypothetical protein JKF63_02638 [Porcisia hertigi]|uniref:SEC7 domain-containing protein n=1 Tax=Porcisia hertigi TaxID=2761500 RepID=A0A836HNH0_9TRYP|nr:hypothetical protein JKF63_02638 [Porcisia hertigi]
MGLSPQPELVRRTVTACRIVLLEVRRRVDSSITNTAVKAELQRGLRAAELALPIAEQTARVHSQGSGLSTSGAPGRTSTSARLPLDQEGAVRRPKTTTARSPNNTTDVSAQQSSSRSGEDDTNGVKRRLSSSCHSGGETAASKRPVGTGGVTDNSLSCTALQSAAVWSYVLSAVFWKRRKLTEYTLTALQLLLRVAAVPPDLVTLIVDPAALTAEGTRDSSGGFYKGCRTPGRSSRMLVSAPTGVYYVLSECLLQSFPEPAVQMRALRLIRELVTRGARPPREARADTGAAGRQGEANGFPVCGAGSGIDDMATCFRGQAAIEIIESCFTVATEGTQNVVRHEARLALGAAVRCVVHAFVTMQTYDGALDCAGSGAEPRTTFTTDTVLADYTVDVDHNEPYTWIHLMPSGKSVVVPTAQRSSGKTHGDATIQSQQGERRPSSITGVPTASSSPQDMKQMPRSCDANSSVNEGASNAQAPPPTHTLPSRASAFSVQLVNAQPCSYDGPRGPAQSSLRCESFDAAAASPLGAVSSRSPPKVSFDPHMLFRNSADESLVLHALSTLNTSDGALPVPLKDLLIVLRRMCCCASRPCSGTPNYANVDVQARDVGLWALECLFGELPVANCQQEHRCAPWMSLVLHACKYELLGCLAKNLAMATPFTLFERAVRLLGMLLRKLHYHMARELHTLLGAFLLPLMVSQYAGFRQKHAVLSMIRQLFTIPHLCVSFFVNYDCNPAFDPGAEYGGMLELLVEHVAEMTFLDHVDEKGDAYPWLSSDQQQLLRSECVVVFHTLMSSLHRWIAQDPLEYVQSMRCNSQDTQWREQCEGDDAMDATDSYRNRSLLAEVVDSHQPSAGRYSATAVAASRAKDAEGSSSQNGSEFDGCDVALAHNSDIALPYWNKEHNIGYHWKHIHYLLHDKRISQEAVQRINAGRWREAKEFLESRGLLAVSAPSEVERTDPTSVAAGTSSFALFARFLFEYPGISRDALSSIFERVNHKDGASRMVLQEYLHCFTYTDVPMDVAMRDTTCRFMSWDRPMFEAKVWETIQQCFGNEYAKQNPGFITAHDADVMAGVLLFLHSNLHNPLVKKDRMQVSQFVRDANACLEFPMMETDLHAMFNRILRCKWELDIYGRTPQQAEKESTLMRLSVKIQMERAAQSRQQSAVASNSSIVNCSEAVLSTSFSAPSLDGDRVSTAVAAAAKCLTTSTDDFTIDTEAGVADDAPKRAEECEGSLHRNTFPSPKAKAARNSSVSIDGSTLRVWMSNDVALLDHTIPNYVDKKGILKTKEGHYHAFHNVSTIYLHKLESVHRLYCIEGEAYRPQPYVVPCYAEHVRQMLLLTYPHVMSCVYMGFRVLEEAPITRKLLDTMQITYDIAAAFVLNLRDLRPVMEEALQRYLDDERAYRLLPLSRATFVPFSLNVL